MQKKSNFFLSLLLITNNILNSAVITYQFSGGRFGDNLLAYLRAKWVAFSYNQQISSSTAPIMPILYKPFKYSDQLVLDQFEKQQMHLVPKHELAKSIIINNGTNIDIKQKNMYIVPYFSEAEGERKLPWNRHWIFFQVDWDNKKFYEEIVKLVKPIDPRIEQFNLPKNCITVALHIRKGEGFDGPLLSDDTSKRVGVNYADFHVPLKFPPDHFFVDQLKEISKFCNHQKIYAFIFTDASQPRALAEKLKKSLPDYRNIEFDYRKSYNFHDVNVLEDFFAMTKFDCLIRGESNFSIMAAKIANYKLEIYPVAQHWEGHKSVIDKVMIKKERQFH